jgi:hypothetical protein
MKIGLITFHNALNYGAILQTYATQKFLIDNGHICEIIDYNNDSRIKAYNLKEQAKDEHVKNNYKHRLKLIIGSYFLSRRRVEFDKFSNSMLRISKKNYSNSLDLKILNDEYDFFIVGSDQVWNAKNNGSDMTYLLDFVNDKKRTMSYASSFGSNTTPNNLVELYKENLNNINFLSTRERNGQDLIRKLTGRNAELVLDPVFLLTTEEWTRLSENSKKSSHKLVFTYTNRKNQFENTYRKFKNQFTKFKIHKINRFISPFDIINPKTVVDYYISPQKFLNNIRNSEIVFTASFHCVAFSIIFEKDFFVYLTGDDGKDERILNLLKTTGLENRIYSNNITKDDLEKEIDYTQVRKKLESCIEHSQIFIKENLTNFINNEVLP